jgi:hypothetical protein
VLTLKNRITVLLTATINPKNIMFVQRNDTKTREGDYINSLKMWLQSNIPSLVFCENSGYNLNKIKYLLDKYRNIKTEVIQFEGNNFKSEWGKGYGELLIIKYAIQNSNIINSSDYVIKVTGRYFIKNVNKIINFLSMNNDLYVMADLNKNLTWADSRIFAFKPHFILNYLSSFQDYINDSKGFYLEHALSKAVLRAISDGYKWLPLPSKPIIIGYSGTSNFLYRNSKILWLVGEAIHRIKNYLIEKH